MNCVRAGSVQLVDVRQPLSIFAIAPMCWSRSGGPSQARTPALQEFPRFCSARVPAGDVPKRFNFTRNLEF